jgi:hypothetical protein
MTEEERIIRLEEAIREIFDSLEDIADRDWPIGSKVNEIVEEG